MTWVLDLITVVKLIFNRLVDLSVEKTRLAVITSITVEPCVVTGREV